MLAYVRLSKENDDLRETVDQLRKIHISRRVRTSVVKGSEHGRTWHL